MNSRSWMYLSINSSAVRGLNMFSFESSEAVDVLVAVIVVEACAGELCRWVVERTMAKDASSMVNDFRSFLTME